MDIPIDWIKKINLDTWYLQNTLPAQSTICLDKISLIGGFQSLGRTDQLITKM